MNLQHFWISLCCTVWRRRHSPIKKSQQERLSKSLILTNIFRNSCRKDDDDDERNLVCNDISIYTSFRNLHNII